MPLVRSFWLSKKKGNEAWVRPEPDRLRKQVCFEIGTGREGPPIEHTVDRTGATCLLCGSPVPLDHIRAEGKAGRFGTQLMAIVAEVARRRIYLPPNAAHEEAADVQRPENVPDSALPEQALGFRVQGYGMTHHSDLFTNRQLIALCTLSDLVQEAREQVFSDSGGDSEYSDAVATYLAFGVSRLADLQNALAGWENTRTQVRHLFIRQAIPMAWDFAECGLFANAAGDFGVSLGSIVSVIETLSGPEAEAHQADAAHRSYSGLVVSTDPPYYDNVGYADLSDFFYVWLRRSLRNAYPDLLDTMLTPKADELIADPSRFGGVKDQAEYHFESGFRRVFASVSSEVVSDTPITIFYAFKQSETDDDHDGSLIVASTGWEKMLEGLIQSGLAVTGTWPMRTELDNRMRNQTSNALASSIVLVCRPRPLTAGLTDRRGFIQVLKANLGHALRDLQSGGIAPVDLAQAAIGPGMAVFSRFAKVVEANGDPMRVRTALALINQVLDEVSAEQEGEFDEDTRWAIAWYADHGMDDGPFGRADDLSRAKNVSVDGLVRAGLREVWRRQGPTTGSERVGPELGPDQGQPSHRLGGHAASRPAADGENEASAAELLAKVGGLGDAARDLAYRLFQIAESKKWAKEAGPYNALAASWLEISRLAAAEPDGQGLSSRG
jgi:putative DNA methylase